LENERDLGMRDPGIGNPIAFPDLDYADYVALKANVLEVSLLSPNVMNEEASIPSWSSDHLEQYEDSAIHPPPS